jgi:hypothetical protein
LFMILRLQLGRSMDVFSGEDLLPRPICRRM